MNKINSIHIVTHPLKGNYGGMLQAYALQKTLQNLHKESFILDYKTNNYSRLRTRIKQTFIIPILYLLGIYKRVVPAFFLKSVIKKFKRNSKLSISIPTDIKKNDYCIVGSDQVWRVKYAKWLKYTSFFFLDFITKRQRQKSIAYSASFGTDYWEGSIDETKECGKLLRDFRAVSVREFSGIKLCNDLFGVKAVQMPDPTLLQQQTDYDELITKETTWSPQQPYIASYILDESKELTTILQQISKQNEVIIHPLLPRVSAAKRRDRYHISVAQWLRLIRDSKYVITDSFHGCAFSIIYNKPFICLGNDGRGAARFNSLFKTFGLEDRIITNIDADKAFHILNTPIDWERVNTIRRSEQERAFGFLRRNLE